MFSCLSLSYMSAYISAYMSVYRQRTTLFEDADDITTATTKATTLTFGGLKAWVFIESCLPFLLLMLLLLLLLFLLLFLLLLGVVVVVAVVPFSPFPPSKHLRTACWIRCYLNILSLLLLLLLLLLPLSASIRQSIYHCFC